MTDNTVLFPAQEGDALMTIEWAKVDGVQDEHHMRWTKILVNRGERFSSYYSFSRYLIDGREVLFLDVAYTGINSLGIQSVGLTIDGSQKNLELTTQPSVAKFDASDIQALTEFTRFQLTSADFQRVCDAKSLAVSLRGRAKLHSRKLEPEDIEDIRHFAAIARGE